MTRTREPVPSITFANTKIVDKMIVVIVCKNKSSTVTSKQQNQKVLYTFDDVVDSEDTASCYEYMQKY